MQVHVHERVPGLVCLGIHTCAHCQLSEGSVLCQQHRLFDCTTEITPSLQSAVITVGRRLRLGGNTCESRLLFMTRTLQCFTVPQSKLLRGEYALPKQTCGAHVSSKLGVCNKNLAQLVQQPGPKKTCPPTSPSLSLEHTARAGCVGPKPWSGSVPALHTALDTLAHNHHLIVAAWIFLSYCQGIICGDTSTQSTHTAPRALCTSG